MPSGITYGVNWGPNNTMYFGSGAPIGSSSEGAYQLGDMIINMYPTVATSTWAWVCVSGGSPGGWCTIALGPVAPGV